MASLNAVTKDGIVNSIDSTKCQTLFKALLAPGLKRKDCVSICNSFVAVIYKGILKELVQAARRDLVGLLCVMGATSFESRLFIRLSDNISGEKCVERT